MVCPPVDLGVQPGTAAEQLNGDNQYKCDKCDALVDAAKRLTLHTLPKLLTVQLKRFGGGMFGGGGAKINKQVHFPPSLQLEKYTSGVIDALPDESKLSKKEKRALWKREKKRKRGAGAADSILRSDSGGGSGEGRFSLCGVVVHHGYSVHSGHYIAYVKSPSQQWFQMDDEEVSQVKQSTVLKQQAYLLFYRREGWEAPAPSNRAEQDAEEERLAALAVEKAAEEEVKRKRRRIMRSSSDEESGSQDSDAGET